MGLGKTLTRPAAARAMARLAELSRNRVIARGGPPRCTLAARKLIALGLQLEVESAGADFSRCLAAQPGNRFGWWMRRTMPQNLAPPANQALLRLARHPGLRANLGWLLTPHADEETAVSPSCSPWLIGDRPPNLVSIRLAFEQALLQGHWRQDRA